MVKSSQDLGWVFGTNINLFSALDTLSSANAQSHFVSVDNSLIMVFRWRKPFTTR